MPSPEQPWQKTTFRETKNPLSPIEQKRNSWIPEEVQEHVIDQLAIKNNISRTLFHGLEPFQMFYVQALHFVATERLNGQGQDGHLLSNEYHWSNVIFSHSLFVRIGGTCAAGAHLTFLALVSCVILLKKNPYFIYHSVSRDRDS